MVCAQIRCMRHNTDGPVRNKCMGWGGVGGIGKKRRINLKEKEKLHAEGIRGVNIEEQLI